MTGRTVFVAAVLAVMVLAGCASQQAQPEPRAEWVPIKISAKGAGAPPATAVNQAQARLMAERAAKVDALRNLLEQAYGVTISSHTTVKDFITQNDTIRARVEAFVRGARVVDTRYLNDGSAEVDVELTLGYEFRRIFP
ncbi:MAG: LPP20 family lipoprotein [Nitrospirae bacterium]|nr:LPP20 family lipoprotein [Nitrospirota bacterium]